MAGVRSSCPNDGDMIGRVGTDCDVQARDEESPRLFDHTRHASEPVPVEAS